MIQIPPNLEAAEAQLASLDKLVTAKDWERAAIVYAFTEPVAQGTRTDLFRTEQVEQAQAEIDRVRYLSFNEFATLRIQGLRSYNSVARYHAAWQEAVDQEAAVEVHPGDTVQLPDLPWPPHPKRHTPTTSEVHDKLEDPETAREFFSSPEGQEVVQQAVSSDPLVAQAATRGLEDRRERSDQDLTPPRPQSPTSELLDTRLLQQFRRVRREVQRAAELIGDGEVTVYPDQREAYLELLSWTRTSLDLLEAGIRDGSVDDAVARILQEDLT